MKKLKKLSLGHRPMGEAKSKKLNKKSVVVFIYGPIAVGKLTVAKILSKKLGYKLAHNHHLNDFVREVFDRGTYADHYMKDYLRYFLLENTVKFKINLVSTHCYTHDFVSKTGLSDPKYVETLEKKLTKLGAKFCPIHLKATNQELLRRVNTVSRKKFHKLKNKKIMRQYLTSLDWQTSPKLKDNLIIDNTKLSPKKVADMIIKYFKLSKN
ncbi:MAG: AAA family ATPase [Candidatus Paceibacterota bacterium]